MLGRRPLAEYPVQEQFEEALLVHVDRDIDVPLNLFDPHDVVVVAAGLQLFVAAGQPCNRLAARELPVELDLDAQSPRFRQIS